MVISCSLIALTCMLVGFSEEFAKEGISSQIYSLINNEKFRPTTNLIISSCDAYEYLKNIKPNLEKLTTNYYDTFSLTNKFTGYFSNITIGEFFNTLSTRNSDGTAILGGLNANNRSNEEESSSENSSSSESSSQTENENVSVADTVTNIEQLVAGTSSIQGKRGTENIGIAVFNNDKMCGKLDTIETMCHLLLKNEIKTKKKMHCHSVFCRNGRSGTASSASASIRRCYKSCINWKRPVRCRKENNA